jgi:hypothetical protein
MGQRFGLLAFSLCDVSDFMMLNAHRRRELAGLFEWIARRPLPVALDGCPYVMPMYAPVSEHTAIAAFANCATERYNRFVVRFGKGVPVAVSRLSRGGVWESASAEAVFGNVVFNEPLEPCDLQVYRLDFDA